MTLKNSNLGSAQGFGIQKSNTPQQATGHDLTCSFRPKGRGIWPSRHSPNIRASAAAWLIARGNEHLYRLSIYRTGNSKSKTIVWIFTL